MRKNVTKAIVLTSALLVLAMGMVGCKKVECDFCGEMKKCKTEEFLGKETNICEDCQEDLDSLGSMFGQ